MKPRDLPDLDPLPAVKRSFPLLTALVLVIVLVVFTVHRFTGSNAPAGTKTAGEQLAGAQFHSWALARSIASQPPVSTAQVDSLLTDTRALYDRLRDDEARAWVMRDIVDLLSARQMWQLAEQHESMARAAWAEKPAGERPAMTIGQYRAAEYRRRAHTMLWRFHQLGPVRVPEAAAPPAPTASTAASAPSVKTQRARSN